MTATTFDLTEELSSAIGRAYGRCAKTTAAAAGTNPRTARNWIDALNTPGAPSLIRLMRESDEVFEAVMRLSGRDHVLDPDHKARIEAAIQIIQGKR